MLHQMFGSGAIQVPEHIHDWSCHQTWPREASTLIFKIRSRTVRSDLKSKPKNKSVHFSGELSSTAHKLVHESMLFLLQWESWIMLGTWHALASEVQKSRHNTWAQRVNNAQPNRPCCTGKVATRCVAAEEGRGMATRYGQGNPWFGNRVVHGTSEHSRGIQASEYNENNLLWVDKVRTVTKTLQALELLHFPEKFSTIPHFNVCFGPKWEFIIFWRQWHGVTTDAQAVHGMDNFKGSRGGTLSKHVRASQPNFSFG